VEIGIVPRGDHVTVGLAPWFASSGPMEYRSPYAAPSLAAPVFTDTGMDSLRSVMLLCRADHLLTIGFCAGLPWRSSSARPHRCGWHAISVVPFRPYCCASRTCSYPSGDHHRLFSVSLMGSTSAAGICSRAGDLPIGADRLLPVHHLGPCSVRLARRAEARDPAHLFRRFSATHCRCHRPVGLDPAPGGGGGRS